MADEKTVKIKLKNEILGLDGKVKKNGAKLRNEGKFAKFTDKQFAEHIKDLTSEEMQNLAPAETVGDGIKYILSNCIKPANNEEAATLFNYITKINNKMDTDKAEWTVNKDEMKKFMDLLKTAKENISVVYNGQIEGILEELNAELTLKKDS